MVPDSLLSAYGLLVGCDAVTLYGFLNSHVMCPVSIDVIGVASKGHILVLILTLRMSHNFRGRISICRC